MKKLILIISLITLLPLSLHGAEMVDKGTEKVKIRITSEKNIITAVLNDTPTAQDLIKKLPITLKMNMHQNREYYTDINLSKNTPTQNGYKIGDIGYWTPGNNMVIFYDKGYTSSLIIMGHITSEIETLSNMGNSFIAKIEKIED